MNPFDKSITGTLNKCERPVWTIVDNVTYSSMTVLVDEYSLPCAVSASDVLASFVNGECRGVVGPVYDEGEGYWRFNLHVCSTNADEQSPTVPNVEVRYYSAGQGGVYVSSTNITYSDGSILGKNLKGQGYRLNWK